VQGFDCPSLTTPHSWESAETVRPAVACGKANPLHGNRTKGGGRSPKVCDKSSVATCVRVCIIHDGILILHPANGNFRSLDDLRNYGQRLLATFPDPDATDARRIQLPLEPISPSQADFEREREGDGGALTGCREAVEILTRNPKKGK
jgi:hypothetical protein